MMKPNQFIAHKPLEINDNLGLFLKGPSSHDPYMNSPAYVLMTGRKGLMVYEGEIENILYASHPNMYGTYIIFPPTNPNALNDIKNLKNILKRSNQKVDLIRVKADIAPLWANVLQGRVANENILDYAFPVHTVDTNTIVNQAGPKLYNFKKTLNKLDLNSLQVLPVNFKEHKKFMLSILREWLNIMGFQGQSNPIEPAFYVIDELSNQLELDGFIVFQKEKPVGFTILEKPILAGKAANAIIHCALHIQGLSEFIHYKMADILFKEGINSLCIGGAETEGLDAFKRKMNPIISTSLKTIKL